MLFTQKQIPKINTTYDNKHQIQVVGTSQEYISITWQYNRRIANIFQQLDKSQYRWKKTDQNIWVCSIRWGYLDKICQIFAELDMDISQLREAQPPEPFTLIEVDGDDEVLEIIDEIKLLVNQFQIVNSTRTHVALKWDYNSQISAALKTKLDKSQYFWRKDNEGEWVLYVRWGYVPILLQEFTQKDISA